MIQNWEPYDLKDRHSITEAAYLLVEEDPPVDHCEKELPPRMYTYSNRLLRSIGECLLFIENETDRIRPVAFMDEVKRILDFFASKGEAAKPLSDATIVRFQRAFDLSGLGHLEIGDAASDHIAKVLHIAKYFIPLKSEYRRWCESQGIKSKAFFPELRTAAASGQGNAAGPGIETDAVAIDGRRNNRRPINLNLESAKKFIRERKSNNLPYDANEIINIARGNAKLYCKSVSKKRLQNVIDDIKKE